MHHQNLGEVRACSLCHDSPDQATASLARVQLTGDSSWSAVARRVQSQALWGFSWAYCCTTQLAEAPKGFAWGRLCWYASQMLLLLLLLLLLLTSQRHIQSHPELMTRLSFPYGFTSFPSRNLRRFPDYRVTTRGQQRTVGHIVCKQQSSLIPCQHADKSVITAGSIQVVRNGTHV